MIALTWKLFDENEIALNIFKTKTKFGFLLMKQQK